MRKALSHDDCTLLGVAFRHLLLTNMMADAFADMDLRILIKKK